MSTLWRTWGVLLVLAQLEAGPARAQELPLTLHWSAPPECPSERAVLDETATMVRPSAASATHAVTADVTVEALAGGGFRAVLHSERDGVKGERELRDPRCTDLAHAVALVLALSLGADLSPEPEPSAPPPEPAPPPPAAKAQPKPPPAPPEPWEFGVGANVTAGTGVVPELGYGLDVRGMVERSGVRFEMRAGAFYPKRVAVDGKASAEATFYAGQVGVAACYGHPWPMKVGVFGCGGSELSWARGSTRGVSDPGAALGFWPTPFVSAGLRMGFIRAWSLRLEAQAGLSLAVPRYAVAGRGSVYEPETYAFRVALGAEQHF